MTSSSTEAAPRGGPAFEPTFAPAVDLAVDPAREPAVVRETEPTALRLAELEGRTRSGNWTRLGTASVLGDAATESVLSDLAERTRAAARAQGYATGWAQGRRAGGDAARTQAEREARERAAERAAQTDEHALAVAALQVAARALGEATAQVCDSVQSQALDIALQLAEAVLMREVATAADPGADALRRALALVPAGETVTVRLHPRDRAGVDEAVLTGELGADAVRLVDDPTLARGDAVAETDTTVVDATICSALARVREVLAR